MSLTMEKTTTCGINTRDITLRTVFADLCASRDLKPVTLKNYEQRILGLLEDWLDLPLEEITKSMIEVRHKKIVGKAMANATMRTLRTLFEYARARYEYPDGKTMFMLNPVQILTQTKAWHRDNRRKTLVHPKDLPLLFRGIFSAKSPAFRDYLLLLLFTGMRKSEALNLKWSQVDLRGGTITLFDTKNGEDRDVPLTAFVWKLLAMRRYFARNEYVFASSTTDSPISCGSKTMMCVRKVSGLNFSLHDLRRTFASMADAAGLSSEVVACLLGHVGKSVTEGYTIRSTERLRRASQKVSDLIMRYGGLDTNTSSANIEILLTSATGPKLLTMAER